MKRFLHSIIYILIFGYFSINVYQVQASCGLLSNWTIGQNKTLTDSVCSIDEGTIEGIDAAANEADSTNTAVLTLSNSEITVASNGTLAVGSAAINLDETSSITITADGASYKSGNGIWVDDADADGWALSGFTLYTATASGRRRLGLMRSVATADCNDAAGNYNLNNSCGLGDGDDGAVTISANKNINTDKIAEASYADGIAYRVTAPSDSATSVTRYSGSDTISNGIAAGDEVLLINLQGSSTDYADAGNYEFMTVSSVNASTITFTTAITKSFDGTSAANQKVVVQRVPNYTDVTINNGITLTASAYDGLTTTPTGTAGYYTGIVAFRATGTVTVTGSISTAVKGYQGAAAPASSTAGSGGASFCGTGGGTGGPSPTNGTCGGGGGGRGSATFNTGGTGSATGGAGGGGGLCTSANATRASGSGGGGGYGVYGTGAERDPHNGGTNTSGDGGTGASASDICLGGGGGGGGSFGNANLTTMFYGSGGGSGSSYSLLIGGAGGKGGGTIYITGSTVSITGSISANGGNGGDKDSLSSNYSGGGGGGAGGSVYILGTSVTLGTNLVTASGGNGGSATAATEAGDGGVGRIAVGATTVSGTTSPTYTAVSAP